MKAIYENKNTPLYLSIDTALVPTPHFHKEIELIYVYEGSAIAVLDQKCYSIKEGDLFLAFPNQIHYYLNSALGNYSVIVALPDIVYGLKGVFSSMVAENAVIDTNKNPLLKNIFENLKNIEGEYSNTLTCGYLNLIFGEIMSQFNLVPAKHNNPAIAKILHFCSNNFSENLDLDQIAEELHLSRYYISHLLNKHLNLNFNDYINRLRIKEACELLILSDKKIVDISEEVGFGTIRSFNRAFKSVMGITPGDYRKLNK